MQVKIKNITVDEGVVLKRMMPRARGVGARINKRTSHIHVTLSIIEDDKKKSPTKTPKKSK